MYSTRFIELLRESAVDLADGRAVPSGHFLRKHSVKSSECIDLGDTLSSIIKGFVNAPDELKLKILLCATYEDSEKKELEEMLGNLDHVQRLKLVNEGLSKL